MTRKILALLLTLLLCLGAITMTSCAKTEDEQGLKYELNEDKTEYSVVGSTTGWLKKVVIPETFNGKPVTSIAESAFSGSETFTSVIIPDSVKEIGRYAFGTMDTLKIVVIGDGVTSIGEYAFEGCDALASVTIGKNVKEIGTGAFQDCNVFEVVNRSSLRIEIGSSDYGRVALNAKKLNDEASKTVNVNDFIFYDDTLDGVYLLGYLNETEDLKLPEDFKGKNYKIYDSAFYNCNTIKSVTIPEKVTAIGYKAFSSCDGLTSATFEKTAGWQYGSEEIPANKLANVTSAAEYLTKYQIQSGLVQATGK